MTYGFGEGFGEWVVVGPDETPAVPLRREAVGAWAATAVLLLGLPALAFVLPLPAVARWWALLVGLACALFLAPRLAGRYVLTPRRLILWVPLTPWRREWPRASFDSLAVEGRTARFRAKEGGHDVVVTGLRDPDAVRAAWEASA
jgi:hypothetical protein